MPNRILLIDGNNLAVKLYFTLKLSTLDSINTSILYGILNNIHSLTLRFDSYKTILVWDRGKSSYRTKIYPEYKANRVKTYEFVEFYKLLNECRSILDEFHIPQVSLNDTECDDLISILASIFKKRFNILIVSDDKDFLQLIDDNVSLYNPRSKRIIDNKNILQIYKLTPKQILLSQSLMGDSVDNIPGIDGIGKKNAYNIASKFIDIEDFIDNGSEILDQNKPLFKRAMDQKDKVLLSYSLIELIKSPKLLN